MVAVGDCVQAWVIGCNHTYELLLPPGLLQRIRNQEVIPNTTLRLEVTEHRETHPCPQAKVWLHPDEDQQSTQRARKHKLLR